MKKFITIASTVTVVLCIFVVATINLVCKSDTGYSESEKRELAQFPAISAKLLADGSFFKGIEAYVNDHFVRRDEIIAISKKITLLFGLPEKNDGFIYIGDKTTDVPDDTDNIDDKINDALDSLTGGTGNTDTREPESTTEIDFFYDPDISADFLPNGLFVYNGAVYTQGNYAPKNLKTFAGVVQYYNALFKDSRVSVLIAPVSSMTIKNTAITSKIVDQRKSLDTLGSLLEPDVNYVNVYDALLAHSDEYLFFKTDHHWTALGAYYAYAEFVKSVGFEPVSLAELEKVTISDDYHGSMYEYTKDERVKQFSDRIDAWLPRKSHTMTITYKNGTIRTFDSCILYKYSGIYSAFLGGDNPLTVINVPENPQDRNILVFKDSFGCALIPFLCEHYGNIYVIDPRHSDFNVYEKLKNINFSDVLLLNNIQSPNSQNWSKLYLRAVGVR